jgi:lysophospholipase L1-like esterase
MMATLALGACGAAAPGATTSNQPTSRAGAELVLAAFGDSITADPDEWCPGCPPFVDRYAEALTAATGTPVVVRNHGRPGLSVATLLQGLTSDSGLQRSASAADVVIVGIGTSDVPWNITDDACDGPATAVDIVPWEQYSDACIETEVERFRPIYAGVFERLAELRGDAPTIRLAIDQYDSWVDFDGGDVPVRYLSAWNAMICETAEAHGFRCGHVGRAFNGVDGRTAAGDLLAPDQIHPSDKGHERIAEVLLDLGFVPLVDE